MAGIYSKREVTNLPRMVSKCASLTLEMPETDATDGIWHLADCAAHVLTPLFNSYADSVISVLLIIPVSSRAHELVHTVSYLQIFAISCECAGHFYSLRMLASVRGSTIISTYIALCSHGSLSCQCLFTSSFMHLWTEVGRNSTRLALTALERTSVAKCSYPCF